MDIEISDQTWIGTAAPCVVTHLSEQENEEIRSDYTFVSRMTPKIPKALKARRA